MTRPESRRGFPTSLRLETGELVEADRLLPTAAAFLDGLPPSDEVSADELAAGIGIALGRALAILDQLQALGHVGPIGSTDERPIFDPDGPTDPTPLDR